METQLKNTINELTLYTDFCSKLDKFAIVDKNSNPVWFGKTFDYLEQSKDEMDAAKKAAWLAGKIKTNNNLDNLTLRLFVDAQWLCYANIWKEESRIGGKAKYLALTAQKAGIKLIVEWIPSEQNLADPYTRGTGFKKYDIDKVTDLIETREE